MFKRIRHQSGIVYQANYTIDASTFRRFVLREEVLKDLCSSICKQLHILLTSLIGPKMGKEHPERRLNSKGLLLLFRLPILSPLFLFQVPIQSVRIR